MANGVAAGCYGGTCSSPKTELVASNDVSTSDWSIYGRTYTNSNRTVHPNLQSTEDIFAVGPKIGDRSDIDITPFICCDNLRLLRHENNENLCKTEHIYYYHFFFQFFA